MNKIIIITCINHNRLKRLIPTYYFARLRVRDGLSVTRALKNRYNLMINAIDAYQ